MIVHLITNGKRKVVRIECKKLTTLDRLTRGYSADVAIVHDLKYDEDIWKILSPVVGTPTGEIIFLGE